MKVYNVDHQTAIGDVGSDSFDIDEGTDTVATSFDSATKFTGALGRGLSLFASFPIRTGVTPFTREEYLHCLVLMQAKGAW